MRLRNPKRVTLSKAPEEPGDSDGFFEALSPATWWFQMDPFPPSESDGQRTQPSLLTGRYHPQITLDTRVVYEDPDKGTRELFVKGIQNIDERGAWMRLHCEEVIK